MLITKTSSGGIQLGEKGITLSRDEWESVKEYCDYLNSRRVIEDNLDSLIEMFLSIGGDDNVKRANYIDEHCEELCEKLQSNANSYMEEAVAEAESYGVYSIRDEIWVAIEDAVDWGAGVKNSNDDEFGE